MADMEPQRRTAVICLLGDLAAVGFQLIGPGGRSRGGLLTGVLLVAVVAAAARVVAARREVASQAPAAQVHGVPPAGAGAQPEGQELGRALENLVNSRYQAGHGWARCGVLLAPSRPASGQPSTSRSSAPRRRLLAIASTPEGR